MSDTPEIHLERLLEIAAFTCYGATLVGHPAPKVEALGKRMRDVRVGDIVVEQSTMWDASRTGTRLGRLLRIAQEPTCTPEEWVEGGGGDDPVPKERVYYIQTLDDGQEMRWVNASFIAIPDTLDFASRNLSGPHGGERR